jgi:hypothetical protein
MTVAAIHDAAVAIDDDAVARAVAVAGRPLESDSRGTFITTPTGREKHGGGDGKESDHVANSRLPRQHASK